MNLSSRLLLPCLALLCGCPPGSDPRDAGPDAPPDVPTTAPTAELGTGQSSWEDIARPLGRSELIYGAQGGYHVWGRARFRGFAPDVDVSFQATRVDTGAVLHMPQPAHRWIENGIRRGLIELGDGTYATDAELVILGISCASEVVGQTLQVQVFVRERATGRVATDTRVFTVVDETPSPACTMPTG